MVFLVSSWHVPSGDGCLIIDLYMNNRQKTACLLPPSTPCAGDADKTSCM